jgi:hypothetical protein
VKVLFNSAGPSMIAPLFTTRWTTSVELSMVWLAIR